MLDVFTNHPLFKGKRIFFLCGLLLTTLTAACTTLLPSDKKTMVSVCDTFDACVKVFDRIVPYETTISGLKALGLDPDITPNMKLLDYSDILNRFNYSASHRNSFPRGIRECVESMDSCRGYDLVISRIYEKRTGNLVLDLFNFQRTSETKGWIFKTLLVLKHDLVVYKLRGGTPKVDETSVGTKPLGPFQSLGVGSLPF